LPNKLHAGPRNYSPAAMEWSRLLLCDVICSERIPLCHCQRVMGVHSTFFVPGDLDLDIQTPPSKGSNTSSLWIWHKYIQRFQGYLIHKQQKTKSETELKTEPYLCAVITGLASQ